jgi:hypothetical protein
MNFKVTQKAPSIARVAAGAFEFLTLIQVFDGPERQCVIPVTAEQTRFWHLALWRLVRGEVCVSELPLNPSAQPLWPAAVIVFGLSLTVSWVILLGYGLVRLIERAI